MEFRPLMPDDLELFRQTGGNQSFDGLICQEYGRELSKMPIAVTAWDDGTPVAMFGIQHLWHGRALAWAFMADSLGTSLITITRKCRKLMAESGYRRIEMHVEADFGAGERWASLLGFKKEAELSRFFPDGSDATMWVRLNNG